MNTVISRHTKMPVSRRLLFSIRAITPRVNDHLAVVSQTAREPTRPGVAEFNAAKSRGRHAYNRERNALSSYIVSLSCDMSVFDGNLVSPVIVGDYGYGGPPVDHPPM